MLGLKCHVRCVTRGVTCASGNINILKSSGPPSTVTYCHAKSSPLYFRGGGLTPLAESSPLYGGEGVLRLAPPPGSKGPIPKILDGLWQGLLARSQSNATLDLCVNVLVRPARISPRESGAAGPCSTLQVPFGGCTARPYTHGAHEDVDAKIESGVRLRVAHDKVRRVADR